MYDTAINTQNHMPVIAGRLPKYNPRTKADALVVFNYIFSIHQTGNERRELGQEAGKVRGVLDAGP